MDVGDLVAGMIRRIVAFLVIGAAAWAAFGSTRETLVVTRERAAAIEASWHRMTGGPPSAGERRELLEREVEDEICFREAVRLGLDRGSRFVDDRLATVLRSIGGKGTDADLAREGRRLGLDRTDVVVRRHLVEDVRQRIRREGASVTPTAGEILARVRAEVGPSRIALRQVFFDAERRGARGEVEARAAAARLRAGSIDLAAARAASDGFAWGVDLPPLSEREIAVRFGRPFARDAFALADGEWSGPLRSAYGHHVVRVESRVEPAPAPAAALRARAEREIRRERGEAALRDWLAARRSRLAIVVEDAAAFR